MIDFDLLRKLLLPLLEGAAFSTIFTFAVCIFGAVIAIVCAYGINNGSPVVRRTIGIVSLIVRGFPLLVFLYFIYYGIGSLTVGKASPVLAFFSNPLACALIAFSINHGFFVTQILTGALKNLPSGMDQAAKALGLTRRVAYFVVLFPLALRMMLPAYRNEVVMLFKASSLVTVVTLTDLLSVAKSSVDQNFDPITPFFGAAVLYWIIVQLIQFSFDALDRRINSSSRTDTPSGLVATALMRAVRRQPRGRRA
ncbi:ABC transporter permease subunit [Paraburkholderia sp. MM6662-R1]|uniref:ABC transporter permease subunit n=1 Tax=Paraburkholderia sp. MM6662-R1 TaxID=2991066 RepID=UPI003D24F6CE